MTTIGLYRLVTKAAIIVLLFFLISAIFYGAGYLFFTIFNIDVGLDEAYLRRFVIGLVLLFGYTFILEMAMRCVISFLIRLLPILG